VNSEEPSDIADLNPHHHDRNDSARMAVSPAVSQRMVRQSNPSKPRYSVEIGDLNFLREGFKDHESSSSERQSQKAMHRVFSLLAPSRNAIARDASTTQIRPEHETRGRQWRCQDQERHFESRTSLTQSPPSPHLDSRGGNAFGSPPGLVTPYHHQYGLPENDSSRIQCNEGEFWIMHAGHP
jgi:hypothetical protein